jgi:hypothetical protein
MMRPASRLLVIDACVVGQAGSDQTTDIRSASCHRVLLEVYENGHCVALSRKLLDEWKRHKSPRANRWLYDMYGKKHVEMRVIVVDVALRKSLEACAANDGEKARMSEDMHLIELALATDHSIISCDARSRTLFQRVACRVVRIGAIIWVDPTIQHEKPIEWLRAGAPREEHRRLDRSQPE